MQKGPIRLLQILNYFLQFLFTLVVFELLSVNTQKQISLAAI